MGFGQRTAAAAGLFHYVTEAGPQKEAATQVDIGFHYVATANGLPNDTDGDGIADYLEDRNGNGTTELSLGETDYLVPNGQVSASNISIFSSNVY